MHTFEVICCISKAAYEYLHNNLPFLTSASKRVERTNYYSAKGITQIELRTYNFSKKKDDEALKKYYIVLRCNPSIIMGDSRILLVDLEKYSADEIIKRLLKRIYEINQLRYIRLHELPIMVFLVNRADIATDLITDYPQLIVWLCNMSFPFGYRNMKRKVISKEMDRLYVESCCFYNKSRAVNIYYKWIALVNTGKTAPKEEQQRVRKTVRAEIQIQKSGIYNMKLPTKRSIEPFLQKEFCMDYLKKEIKNIFGIEKYVSRRKAVEIINNSHYKPYEKAVMLSIVDMIQQYKGLYELEKAVADTKVYTPLQYGNIRTFKERWLQKFKRLGIQPVVIPDSVGIDEMPSVYELLTKESEDLT